VGEAERVGAILVGAEDLDRAAADLRAVLAAPTFDTWSVRRLGLEPILVESLWMSLGQEKSAIERACGLGEAWVRGRRSARRADGWELVASVPGGGECPTGLRRTTGETLIALVTEATARVRLSAPFIDARGLAVLTDALVGATTRRVEVEVFDPGPDLDGVRQLDALANAIRRWGRSERLRISRTRADAPWAHLKVLVRDGDAAYIGSANVTGRALFGTNLELGVLVWGPDVAVVERLLDHYRE
jgi:phosphatidylserine/phosphatidylglycerophosphate/cardiolipin synthase-like enzyme